MDDDTTDIERRALAKGMRMTAARRLIARVLLRSTDHPDVETLFARIRAIDPQLGIATVYRTLSTFVELGLVDRHAFAEGERFRYEVHADGHHDHIVDVQSGAVVEFHSEELERLQQEAARKLGYRLVDHRCELYGEKKVTS